MNAAYATDLLKLLMTTAVTLAAPILLTAMVIGLAVSLFQAVTSIQEQTLTFVPKVLAIVLLLILLMPWMLRTLVEFAAAMIGRMPQMVQ
ncbi:MAG TPA: flagellar biosynthesis protein FliQ [Candidatus Cybelea sp.]|jgi:flagellar biosynthetic protein FliQ|nr:flagellar biosynthesis protein FliQ [Candidatus Cybelea sp.]